MHEKESKKTVLPLRENHECYHFDKNYFKYFLHIYLQASFYVNVMI